MRIIYKRDEVAGKAILNRGHRMCKSTEVGKKIAYSRNNEWEEMKARMMQWWELCLSLGHCSFTVCVSRVSG